MPVRINPSVRPYVCIMRCGSITLKRAVGEGVGAKVVENAKRRSSVSVLVPVPLAASEILRLEHFPVFHQDPLWRAMVERVGLSLRCEDRKRCYQDQQTGSSRRFPQGYLPLPLYPRFYSVSQCSWATSGLPRLGNNEKGATTPAILHKAANQPEVQYHCITL